MKEDCLPVPEDFTDNFTSYLDTKKEATIREVLNELSRVEGKFKRFLKIYHHQNGTRIRTLDFKSIYGHASKRSKRRTKEFLVPANGIPEEIWQSVDFTIRKVGSTWLFGSRANILFSEVDLL